MDCSRCKNGILEKYYEAEYHDIYRCKNCEYEEIKRSDECCRNPNKIVVNDVKFFPNFRLYEQCKNCGGAKRNFPVKYTSDIDIRGEFDSEYFEEWREKVNFDKKLIYESVSYSNYLSSPKGKYHKYLESPEWRAKREMVFKRDGYTCTKCKSRPAFHAHHLTYKNIFNEKLEDLISVCAECHSQIHYEELMQKIDNLKKQ
ncbi:MULTISPECIES: HNH endonuclease [Empedobacter]|uniref:HNH endonuclease n=1 Tax=Empedobacter TaxID=59734 RepID=UPI001C59F1D2|nr:MULTISPECIES: hypothetical protein [Empedobacter]MBW1619032.1 hypothetical protein [Empedobacter falsenii]MDM1040222.1 hypothetical protein [Empedobacter brevis]MDM1134154.1 hypothetical protein [Empedobacter sp. R750]